jgi:hypothetical protein
MWASAPLTVFVHGGLETLVESAGPTLVAVRLVNRTAALQVSGCFARVHSIPVNTSLEEARATYETVGGLVQCQFRSALPNSQSGITG